MKHDLITLEDIAPGKIHEILELAQKLKREPGWRHDALQGKSLGLVFQKPSNRTRVSFEVGIHQLGGNCIYLGPQEINLGKRESTADVARTLSRYLNGIVARTNTHAVVTDLARYASIPVINGLSDRFHPCQVLADLLSITEHFPGGKDIKLAYIGDGNNVCHSLLVGCAKMGIHMVVASPPGYEPDPTVVSMARHHAAATGCSIDVTQDPLEAVKGARIIYADVWTSMGQETEAAERLASFRDYQINDELLQPAAADYIFMHCLPAHRGEEVTESIIDGPHSIVFEQAENRLHAQKAVLLKLFDVA